MRLAGLAAVMLVTAGALGGDRPVAAAPAALSGTIVFTSERDGDADIYTIKANGTGLRKLTRNRTSDFCPAWSPDGTRIAYSATAGRGDWHIYVMRRDGRILRRLTAARDVYDSCPDWSPDGRWIVFSRVRHWPRIYDLFVIGADGRGFRRITHDLLRHRRPSWSPDGRRLAWFNAVFTPNHVTQLYEVTVMNLDGSGLVRLTRSNAGYGASDPEWSPDGRRIAFVWNGQTEDRFQHVFVMNADGTDPREVPNSSHTPAWSPDGKWLVYANWVAQDADLFISAPDGTGARRLTRARGWDRDPDWTWR